MRYPWSSYEDNPQRSMCVEVGQADMTQWCVAQRSAFETVRRTDTKSKGEHHALICEGPQSGFSSKFELFLVIVRMFCTEYTLVDYRCSGSSHDDPPEPPKTPLLDDNSAPSLYPSTYTMIVSEARCRSLREQKSRYLIPVKLLPGQRQGSPQPLERLLAHFVVRIAQRLLIRSFFVSD